MWRTCGVYYYSEEDVRGLLARAGIADYRLVAIRHSGGGFLLSGRAPASDGGGDGQ